MFSLPIVLALIVGAIGHLQLESNTVVLDYGTFNGQLTDGVASFLGVRYADPPVGDLRWRPPIMPPSTQLGIVNATAFADTCIAVALNGATSIPDGQSEDCLYVNVYAPVGESKPLPVMVYFHGGGFANGSTHSYSPMYIQPASTEPFIFVTFEYRLAGFGFLSGKEVAKDGAWNVGMLDQRAGLRWIQRYISRFGGDPTRTTIWGQSAGGASTMYHLIANGGHSEGLFHQAMGDSASLGAMPSADSEYDESVFQDFAAVAGCASSRHVMACLRKANSTVIATTINTIAASRNTTLFLFGPRLDGSFLTSAPVEAFKAGKFARVPVFFGGNSGDGEKWSHQLPASADTTLPGATEDTVYNFLQGQFDSLTRSSFDRALDLYPLENYGSYDLQGQQMYGEMRYICSSLLITQNAVKHGQPAYAFLYNDDHLGSFHGAELFGLIQAPSSAIAPDASDDEFFIKQRQYYSSFVTGGVPMAANASTWEAVTIDGSPRMLLDPTNTVTKDIPTDEKTRCDFWHDLSTELTT